MLPPTAATCNTDLEIFLPFVIYTCYIKVWKDSWVYYNTSFNYDISSCYDYRHRRTRVQAKWCSCKRPIDGETR